MTLQHRIIALYYRLPSRLRRLLYRIFSPRSFGRLQRERAGRFSPCFERKAIFVHIPKCGGMAVGTALFGHGRLSHRPIKDYQVIFTPEEFETFYKFTVVRNPWDRLVSGWHYLRGQGGTDGDRAWAAMHLSRYADFDDFVINGLHRREILGRQHFRPQFGYVCLPGQREILVDQVCRVESLQQDIDLVCAAIGIAPVSVEKINASRHRDYREYYSERTRQKVAAVYADDIALFGYQFD